VGYFPEDPLEEIIPGSTLSGSGTTPEHGYIIQSGTTVVTMSGGLATINFPKPFPNALLAVLACNGDTGATTQVANGTVGTTTSSFQVRAGGYSGGYRVNWIAIGW
jgi:hypothetical protein